jgi:hypothetical protein
MNFGVFTMVPARVLVHPRWDFFNVLCRLELRLNSVIPNMGKLSMFLLFFCNSFS